MKNLRISNKSSTFSTSYKKVRHKHNKQLKTNTIMTKSEIWDFICEMACSQGFYGRLKRDILESGHAKEILQEWENKGFRDTLDFIMYLES